MAGNGAREAIFARLRKAAGATTENEILREAWSLGHAPQPDLPAGDPRDAFVINVQKNRGGVALAADRAHAVRAIAELIYQQHRMHRLVAGNDARLAALPWRDAGLLPRFGSVVSGEPVALSYARLGIAELGGVVTLTGKANPSANNLLCEHHIVLLDSSDIVSDSEEAWTRLNEAVNSGSRPRGINIIAGPSSTADIEGQLVYGAHGPRRWDVIVVGAMPETAAELVDAAS